MFLKLNIQKVFIFIVIILLSQNAYAGSSYYKELKEYFKENFKGESFVPTPYGADKRFAPKSIWIYLDKFAIDKVGQRKVTGWAVLSSGKVIYTDDVVPVQRAEIQLPITKADIEKKVALSLALSGNIKIVNAKIDSKFLKENNVYIDINIGNSQIEFCYYLDMLLSQDLNEHILSQVNNRLNKIYKKPPKRKVVLSAIRVKDTKIKFVNKDGHEVDFSAEIGAAKFKILKDIGAKLGFEWDNTKKRFTTIELDDWKYIAFQSIFTDPTGKISSKPEQVEEEFIDQVQNRIFLQKIASE